MNWIDVCGEPDLTDDPLGVKAGALDVALYRVDGEVFASAGHCTHGNAMLCDGFLENGEIECPLHQGRFDVRTGKALCAPLTVDIPIYPVRRVDGRIAIGIAD